MGTSHESEMALLGVSSCSGSAQFSKRNARRCGGSCAGGAKRIRPSGSQRFARRASVFVLDTLRRLGVAPHMLRSLHGERILFIWGPATAVWDRIIGSLLCGRISTNIALHSSWALPTAAVN